MSLQRITILFKHNSYPHSLSQHAPSLSHNYPTRCSRCPVALFSGWIRDEENPIIKRVSIKSSEAANLTIETVEELQVGKPHGHVFMVT